MPADSPVCFYPGDILFYAGLDEPPNKKDGLCGHEHVAIVWGYSEEDGTRLHSSWPLGNPEGILLRTHQDFLNLVVLGLPELEDAINNMAEKGGGLVHWCRTWETFSARHLRGNRVHEMKSGCEKRVWNMAGRLDRGFGRSLIRDRFFRALGRHLFSTRFSWKKEPHTCVTNDFDGVALGTSCLGFVLFMLGSDAAPLLEAYHPDGCPKKHLWPSYPDPYDRCERRTFPSIGHLARVLSGDVEPPYPSGSLTLKEDASARVTLQRMRRNSGYPTRKP